MKKGFTLVELLVVIAIISILASITWTTLSSARDKGRDAKRIGEAQQMEKALAVYFTDYGVYPDANDTGGDSGWDDDGVGDGFVPALAGNNVRGDNPEGTIYMNGPLRDPSGGSADNECTEGQYSYHNRTPTDATVTRDTYTILIKLEQDDILNFPDCGLCAGVYDICFTPDN